MKYSEKVNGILLDTDTMVSFPDEIMITVNSDEIGISMSVSADNLMITAPVDKIREKLAEVLSKKEEPMKPKIVNAYPNDLYLCGRCASLFIRNMHKAKMNYCPNCGQKQNWKEDSNDE